MIVFFSCFFFLHFQIIKFKAEDLEERFHHLYSSGGKKIEYLYGNKGL